MFFDGTVTSIHKSESVSNLIRHRGDGGALAPPPTFVAKLFKIIKLKPKVVNILKILTSCIKDA